MAARKTTSAIRGRSMNRNPIDLFKYVPGPFSDLLANRMHAFISSAINWKRSKVKREKQEIKTKSESTEISVVDDLSEYLIENRFATDAQKTGFEMRLSVLIG